MQGQGEQQQTTQKTSLVTNTRSTNKYAIKEPSILPCTGGKNPVSKTDTAKRPYSPVYGFRRLCTNVKPHLREAEMSGTNAVIANIACMCFPQ